MQESFEQYQDPYDRLEHIEHALSQMAPLLQQNAQLTVTLTKNLSEQEQYVADIAQVIEELSVFILQLQERIQQLESLAQGDE